jgi:hypothetical protein
VCAIAETGVDFISIGALTKHVRAIDLSIRFDGPRRRSSPFRHTPESNFTVIPTYLPLVVPAQAGTQ